MDWAHADSCMKWNFQKHRRSLENVANLTQKLSQISDQLDHVKVRRHLDICMWSNGNHSDSSHNIIHWKDGRPGPALKSKNRVHYIRCRCSADFSSPATDKCMQQQLMVEKGNVISDLSPLVLMKSTTQKLKVTPYASDVPNEECSDWPLSSPNYAEDSLFSFARPQSPVDRIRARLHMHSPMHKNMHVKSERRPRWLMPAIYSHVNSRG